MNERRNKLMLIILDGWGIGKKDKADVIFNAHTPNFDSFIENYPNSQLKTSGQDVGLPEWGVRHFAWRIDGADAKDWDEVGYRACCTANSWPGYILASHIMGIKDLWNRDVLFDYQDRSPASGFYAE